MKNIITNTVIISLGIVLSTPLAMSQTLKRWQDADGNWHFGDTIPPEYAQQGHEEVSKQGIVREVKDRAKTDEEIAEEKRLAEIEKQKQMEAEKQARQDRILIDTFSNIEDIEAARDDALAAIDSRIILIEKQNESIQSDLDSRIQQAATQEKNGQKPNEDLLADIESLQKQIKTNQTAIDESRKEQEQVKANYQADIDRYKELKGID